MSAQCNFQWPNQIVEEENLPKPQGGVWREKSHHANPKEKEVVFKINKRLSQLKKLKLRWQQEQIKNICIYLGGKEEIFGYLFAMMVSKILFQ